MKRVLWTLIVIGLCAIGVLFALLNAEQSGSNETTIEVPVEATDSAPTESTDSTDSVPTDAYPVAPETARAATVIRLADGDSFDLRWSDTDERDEVRLFGINAPETGACFGDEAREALDELTAGQTLLVDGVRRDEFGRVLADVWAGPILVNAAMVEQGAALAISGDGAYARLITRAQAFAKDQQLGLWDPARCGADPSAQLLIAAIEADAPGRDNENPNGEWITIANVGDTAVQMDGWSIRDESTRHRYEFPGTYTLAADSEVRVLSGCGEDTSSELFWCDGDPIWNNGGDTGFLVDPDGRFADTLSY